MAKCLLLFLVNIDLHFTIYIAFRSMFLHVVATFSFVFLVLNITSSERSSLMNPFQAGLPLPPYS